MGKRDKEKERGIISNAQWNYCMCVIPVAEPSSVCAPVVEPVGLRSVACAAVSFVCSTLCAAGSTPLAAYLIIHTYTHIHGKPNHFASLLQVLFCCCHGEVYPWQ